MQNHVFAVWDFMSLTKRLQRDLAGTQVPWLPPTDPQAARLINEIVLGEESDDHPGAGHCSHFELYREGMLETGASTVAIDRFVTLQRQGVDAHVALQSLEILPGTARFVGSTLRTALDAPTHCVAAAFLHGREGVIPALFERLLQGSAAVLDQAPMLRHYLNRHIQLDAKDHEPGARAMLERLIGGDVHRRQQADAFALSALEQRIHFWDDLRTLLQEARP
ncbi:mangotoxin biosynthesis-involved protein MgoB [Pseudomonas trivialis]|nr:mangotoxin biosynthesis-involved protein MgoB [Pseudomonas trivialis]